MFGIPMMGGSPKRAGAASTREKVQIAAMIVVVLAMLGWWAARRAKRAAQAPLEVSYGIEDMAEEERKSLRSRKEALELKRKSEIEAAAAGEGGPPTETEKVEPARAPWRYRSVEEIDPEEYEAMVEEERAEEAERAKFLPMLDEFKLLEPDAVRVYRAKIIDRVPGRGKPTFALPDGPGVRYTVQKADGRGLTAGRPDGTERKFTWDEIPVESLYTLGKQIAVLEGPRANEKDAFFLAQLAVLAGEPEEAEGHFKRTVEIKPELAARLSSPKSGKVRLEPTTSLDYRVLDLYSGSFDDPTRPWEGTSVRGDAPSIFHVYRYMRTMGPEGLSEVVEPPTRYELLQRRPRKHRWRVYTIKGRFIRRYKSTRWTGIEGHKGAGIQDVDFCFILGAKSSGIYLVSVPKDTRKFGSSDMVRFTGVYIRRWPYLSHSEWKWIPWIAVLDMEKVATAESGGMRIVGIAVLVATIVGVILVFLFARRESRSTAKAREIRTLRKRSQRDRIRRKAAAASKGGGASEGGKADTDKGGDDDAKGDGTGNAREGNRSSSP